MQGVGFRPFVHRLAGELALDGFVLNDERGVLLEVQGEPDRVAAFLARLRADAPPLAVVERVLSRGRRGRRTSAASGSSSPRAEARPPRSSPPTSRPATTASPSCSTPPTAATATRSSTAPTAARGSRSCAASPTTGRNTTMAGFEMCDACRAEYEDPGRPPLPRPADRLPGLRAHVAPETGIASVHCTPGSDARSDGAVDVPVAGAGWWRSRGSAGTTSRAWPRTSARWRRCGRASTARTSRSR